MNVCTEDMSGLPLDVRCPVCNHIAMLHLRQDGCIVCVHLKEYEEGRRDE